MPAAASEPVGGGREASRDAGIYAYSRVISAVLLLVALAWAARIYSRSEFALLGSILLVYETALTLGSFGFPDAVFYFLGRRPDFAGTVVRQTSFLLLGMTLPVIGIASLALSIMSGDGLELVPTIPWMALLLLFEMPTQPAVNQLLASGHARMASLMYVGFAALRTAAVLVPGLLGRSPELAPMLMAIAGATRLLAHLVIVRRFFPLSAAEQQRGWLRWPELWEIVAYSIPAGLAATSGRLNQQIDKYAVQLLLGPTQFALYAVASWEVPLITLVPYAIGAVLQARYVRLHFAGERQALIELWHGAVRKTALIVVPATVLILVLARDIITLLFSADYAAATLPFQLFTLVLLHRVASYGAMLQALGRTRVLLVNSLLLVGLNAALTYPMTMLLGFSGAALATVLSSVPVWALTLHQIGRGLGVGLRRVLPWGAYGATLLVSALCGLVTWLLLEQCALSPAGRLGLGIPLYGAIVFAAGRATRLVNRDDVDYLRQWLTFRILKR